MIKKIISFGLCLAFAMTMLLPMTGVSAAEDYSDHVINAQTGSFDFISQTGHVAGTNQNNMVVKVTEDPSAKTVTYEHGTGSTYISQMQLDGSFVNANSTWGMRYVAGERYILGGIKLRNLSDEGITPTFGFALLSQSTGSSVGYNSVYDLVDVTATGTQWQEYTGVVTIAETDGGTGSRLMIGIPHGKTTGGPAKVAGAKVLVDVTGAYFTKEVVTITNTTEASSIVFTGETFSAKAQVANQFGQTTGLDQTIEVVVVDGARQNVVSGFTVSNVVNGEYTVTVGNDVPAGDYVVVARNSTNGTLMNKGINFKVLGAAAMEDYVSPSVPSNYFNNNFISLTGSAVAGSTAAVLVTENADNTVLYEDNESGTGQISQMALAGSFYNVKTGFGITYTAGERYVFGGIKLKNVSDTGITPKFGFEILCQGTTVGNSNVYDMVDVTARGDEWQDYSGVVTVAYTDGGSGSRLMLGMPHGNISGFPDAVEGAKVLVDVTGAYFAKEVLHSMTNEIVSGAVPEGSTKVPAGETLTIKTQILNQLGVPGSFDQDVSIMIFDENKTQLIEEITVSNGANGTKLLNIPTTMTTGKYFIFAYSDTYAGVQKGLTIEVTKPLIKDSTAISNTLNAVTITEATSKNTMGVFDTLSFTAKLVDNTGSVGQNVQSFDWYVINEDRTEKVTEGITVTPSQNTQTATLSIASSFPSGSYYLVAESTATESEGMRKGYAFTVDKAADAGIMIGYITGNDAETVETNLSTIIDVLEINDSVATKADAADLANILTNGAADETITDTATLKEYVLRAAVVSLYNNNANNVTLYDADGQFVFAEELNLADLDTNNGGTIYSLFGSESDENSIMSKEGRMAVQNALIKTLTAQIATFAASADVYDSYAEFVDSVENEILLKAIQYPNTFGNGYLDSVLTSANLSAVGITATNYLALSDKGEFNDTLDRNEYTIATLSAALAEAPESGSGGSTGGITGGSTGGGNSNANKPANLGGITGTDAPKQEDVEFTDLSKEHWAYTDIYFLKDLGAISGMTETTFEPEGKITREQFLKILIEALKIPYAQKELAFSDVKAGAWYDVYVQTGVAAGIVNGQSADWFGIGEPITRQDVCVMLARVLGFDTSIVSECGFDDADALAIYAKNAVSSLVEYGIINGFEDNTFRGTQSCTRAQAAKIISNAISVMNAIDTNGR